MPPQTPPLLPQNSHPPQQHTPTQPAQEPFDSSAYIQKNVYDAKTEEIESRLTAVENRVGNNAAVVAMLTDVLEHDRNIDPTIKSYFDKFMSLDPLVEASVNKLDKRTFKAITKKAGLWFLGAVWSIALIVATTYINNRSDKQEQKGNTTTTQQK